jgi:hypothetical protein
MISFPEAPVAVSGELTVAGRRGGGGGGGGGGGPPPPTELQTLPPPQAVSFPGLKILKIGIIGSLPRLFKNVGYLGGCQWCQNMTGQM